MRDHKGLNEIASIIRREIVTMIHGAKSGHPGGSLSAVEILTALYFDEMNIDPTNPKMEDRDRFVLSKGHAAPVLYATLAERGFFDKKELAGFRKLGDGEIQEGIVWEATMSAAHYKLDNLIVFLDYNGLQIDGNIESVMNVNPIEGKFKSFGWNVITIDGHDYDQIFAALDIAKDTVGKPTIIIAKTIKGKGVSFMENQASWHGSALNDAELKQALLDLGGACRE